MDVTITSRDDGELTIVEATGEVDVSSAMRFRDDLTRALADGKPNAIVDLTGVPFLDSTGLGVLVGRLKAMRINGGDMALVISDDRLLRNFKITGLDQVFRLHPTVDHALDSMR
ncbi:STAS domain-containing protein [Leekyejoonella antrihumi]|uniref:Anti-sigma factor antagonist n=1 Tax=Leekyejoonella antrihumi TaxID=1660198 RepID=A0A563DXE3_9MICO|nr:STAS domain-containing protein [Leekyejoonella antrihumi]